MNEKNIASAFATGMAALAILSGINETTADAITTIVTVLLGIGAIALVLILCAHYRQDRIRWHHTEPSSRR